MAKEEGSRLLSKVAKFVRNPLKDWSELDAPDSALPDGSGSGYSREAVKEMIERRQRNDFVRRREFDMLRKLRRREAAGAREAGGTVASSFHLNTVGRTSGRALTLKKIDEIEQQMSQQWWKGRASRPGGVDDGADSPAQTEPLAIQHARAYADTEPGVAPPEPAPAAARPALQLAYETPLEEASVRFAENDAAQAERVLLAALAPDGAQVEHDDTWRALLDFYRATGDAEKFAAASMRYAQRFRRPGPEWVSLRALARSRQDAGGDGAIDWYCPARLGREGLLELTQALSRAGAVWSLDWRALGSIDADAVAPLGTLFGHWADSPVQLRFAGAERLLAVLAEATPLTVRSTDVAWWQLYLVALRLMHMSDDFELVALNYCITYEAAPPPWQDAGGSYSAIEPARASRLGGLHLQSDGPEPAAGDQVRLAGELAGECPNLWQRLDADLAEAQSSTVSCAALVRVDPTAAAGLLEWVQARAARGQPVEFVEVHRLLAAFFTLAGIDAHAGVIPRH